MVKSPQLTQQEIKETKVISGEIPIVSFGTKLNSEQRRLADELAKKASAPPVRSRQDAGSVEQLRSVAPKTSGPEGTDDFDDLLRGEGSENAPDTEVPLPLPPVRTAAPASAPPVRVRSRSRPRLPALDNESIAGLDLWEDRAFVATVRTQGQSIEILKCGSVPFTADMIDQERQQKLRELWRRERIPTRSVWVNFHSQMLVQKFFCMNIPQDELLAALTLEAEESFPSHENEVVLDYHLNEERGPNGELCGMLYALPAWELQAQIAMLKQAGLMVCGVSSGACDLSNLFSLLAPEKTDHFAQCLVNLSTHFADIVIMYGARSIYSRTVLSRSGPWVKNLDYLAENLNDALLYYSQWVSEKQVETILISGTISEEVDICGALLERTGMPVYAWNPFEENSGVRLTAAAKSLDCSPLDLVNSVALAMRRG